MVAICGFKLVLISLTAKVSNDKKNIWSSIPIYAKNQLMYLFNDTKLSWKTDTISWNYLKKKNVTIFLHHLPN